MINNIEQYLAELKKELAGCDRATVQDALSDAEEYLRMALEGAMNDSLHKTEAEVLAPIIERYGQPAEVAAAYKDIENRTPPAFGRRTPGVMATAPVTPTMPAAPPPPIPPAPTVAQKARSPLGWFFGVFADAKAWGGLLFILITFATGIIYFTWAVTGISVSAGLIVVIVGLPILAVFLMSVRGIALIEGRLIEALTGVRMPRRPVFTRSDVTFWQKVKNLFAERQTWTALVYMVVQMPLGIIYFSVFVTLVSVSVYLIIGAPVLVGLDAPFMIIGNYGYYFSAWMLPITIIGGILLLTGTMHLVKLTGRMHGNWAKLMLVKE